MERREQCNTILKHTKKQDTAGVDTDRDKHVREAGCLYAIHKQNRQVEIKIILVAIQT